MYSTGEGEEDEKTVRSVGWRPVSWRELKQNFLFQTTTERERKGNSLFHFNAHPLFPKIHLYLRLRMRRILTSRNRPPPAHTHAHTHTHTHTHISQHLLFWGHMTVERTDQGSLMNSVARYMYISSVYLLTHPEILTCVKQKKPATV